MSAPNFSFEPDGRPSGLPSVAGNGSQAVVRPGYGAANRSEDIFSTGETRASEYRRLFFWYLGLAL
jgi:hypothetical protein